MNRLTKLQQVGAVGVLTKKLAGQLRGKDMVDHLSRECVDFYRSKSVVTGKEVNGIGRTDGEQARFFARPVDGRFVGISALHKPA